MSNHKWKLMDVHTHILPGVDDGAGSMEESLEMLRMAQKEGVVVIIATPHYGRYNPGYDPKQARETALQLRNQMKEHFPEMKLYMGNEIYYTPGVVEDVKSGRARTIGGSDYVLLEFSVRAGYKELYRAVQDFTREGYRPILAHIERYHCLQKEPERIRELKRIGAYMQVNARGFLGGKRDRRAALCRSLLEEGLIDFIASDCHDTELRSPVMCSAVERMVDFVGKAEVKRIVNTNILKLIRNEYI